MISVCGKPFLKHQIDMLAGHGISRMLFLLAYKNELIIEFLRGVTRDMKLDIDYCTEESPLGTGGLSVMPEITSRTILSS